MTGSGDVVVIVDNLPDPILSPLTVGPERIDDTGPVRQVECHRHRHGARCDHAGVSGAVVAMMWGDGLGPLHDRGRRHVHDHPDNIGSKVTS